MRTNFSQMQKAQIFARDKAICVYSGVSLWALDWGADAFSRIAWIDHVIPSSKGGPTTLDNGVCCDSWVNYDKRDKVAQPFLLRASEPTAHFRRLNTAKQKAISANLERFSKLDLSDFFFNQAIKNVKLGFESMQPENWDRTRDWHHWARAAHNAIGIWKALFAKKRIGTLEDRGLVPMEPSAEQRLLLEIRETSSANEVYALMRTFAYYCQANLDYREWLSLVPAEFEGTVTWDQSHLTISDAIEAAGEAAKDPYVSDRVKKEIDEFGRALAANQGVEWVSCNSTLSEGDLTKARMFARLMGRGRSRLYAGSFEDAIDIYGEANQLEPTNTEPLLARADAYLALDDAENAIGECNQAIDLEPEDAAAYLTRSEAFLLLGNQKKAIADRRKAERINPEYVHNSDRMERLAEERS